MHTCAGCGHPRSRRWEGGKAGEEAEVGYSSVPLIHFIKGPHQQLPHPHRTDEEQRGEVTHP